jgi:hypothetical protein
VRAVERTQLITPTIPLTLALPNECAAWCGVLPAVPSLVQEFFVHGIQETLGIEQSVVGNDN